jgi:hypothetical protein
MFNGDAIRPWAEIAPRNTDDHPILEFDSGSEHFRLQGTGAVQRTLAEFARMKGLRRNLR